VIVAMTVSGSSSSLTPEGATSTSSVTVAFISRAETSCAIESGMSPGSASMFTSRSSWLKMPPSVTPGDSSWPLNSIGTVAWIATSIRTRRRSTWTASPRTGCRCTSLIRTLLLDPPSTVTSITWPARASVLRRVRASTAKCCGASPPP
jgi:hypothetical protein